MLPCYFSRSGLVYDTHRRNIWLVYTYTHFHSSSFAGFISVKGNNSIFVLAPCCFIIGCSDGNSCCRIVYSFNNVVAFANFYLRYCRQRSSICCLGRRFKREVSLECTKRIGRCLYFCYSCWS